MEYAAHQFRLSKPLNENSNVTKREHFKQLQKQGIDVPELQAPDVSEHTLYLLEWFYELASGRQEVNPIPFSELQSWAQMTGKKLNSFESQLLKQLDRLWLQIYHE